MINGIINDKLENIEENKLFPFENAFNYNKNYKCKSYMKRQIWKKHKLYNKVGLSCHFFKIQYDQQKHRRIQTRRFTRAF